MALPGTTYASQGMPSAFFTAGVRMPSLRATQARGNFFDRKAVIDAIGPRAAQAMMYVGNYIKRIAQNSMRTVAKGTPPAPAGSPPHAIADHPFLKRHLYASYDPLTRSMVIGPERLAASTDAPARLEHGFEGYLPNPRRRDRKVGDVGEIRISPDVRSTDRFRLVSTPLLGDVFVVYGRLTTEALARRSDALNEAMYGPPARRVSIKPHPFIGPAFAAGKARLPEALSELGGIKVV